MPRRSLQNELNLRSEPEGEEAKILVRVFRKEPLVRHPTDGFFTMIWSLTNGKTEDHGLSDQREDKT